MLPMFLVRACPIFLEPLELFWDTILILVEAPTCHGAIECVNT